MKTLGKRFDEAKGTEVVVVEMTSREHLFLWRLKETLKGRADFQPWWEARGGGVAPSEIDGYDFTDAFAAVGMFAEMMLVVNEADQFTEMILSFFRGARERAETNGDSSISDDYAMALALTSV